MTYLRGNVYYADLGYGQKPFLVVSNNARNGALRSALAVRLTTTSKASRPSVVQLPPGEPLVGFVVCDDIETLYDDDSSRHAGALTPATMRAIGEGLKDALALH